MLSLVSGHHIMSESSFKDRSVVIALTSDFKNKLIIL